MGESERMVNPKYDLMENNTLLHRQIHPHFVQKSEVSSQAFEATSSAFKPTPKDDSKLSVYNGEKFSAKEAFEHFVEHYTSIGVLSVSVQEALDIQLSSTEDNIPFNGHAYIDFTGLSSNQMKSKAKLLKKKANDRGWLHFDPNYEQ